MTYIQFLQEVSEAVANRAFGAIDTIKEFFGEERVDIQCLYTSKESYKDFIQEELHHSLENIQIRSLKTDILNVFVQTLRVSSEDIALSVRDYLRNSNELIISTALTAIKDYMMPNGEINLHRFHTISIARTIEIPSIVVYIHFPEVTLTNTFDETYTIKDLYLKARIVGGDWDRQLGWCYGIRTTLLKKEYRHGYIHSHVSRFNVNDGMKWGKCCYGYGPLDLLAGSEELYSASDIAINKWCMLIDQYVTIESTQTNPYFKFAQLDSVPHYNTSAEIYRNIGLNNSISCSGAFVDRKNAFIRRFLTSDWVKKLNIKKGQYYYISANFDTIIAVMTAALIEFINSLELDEGGTQDTINVFMIAAKKLTDGGFQRVSLTGENPIEYNLRRPLFTFKGETKYLVIEDATDVANQALPEGAFYIINPYFASNILNNLMCVYNDYNAISKFPELSPFRETRGYFPNDI